MSRATISLPVPCSPVTRTETSENATCSIVARTRRIPSEVNPGPALGVAGGRTTTTHVAGAGSSSSEGGRRGARCPRASGRSRLSNSPADRLHGPLDARPAGHHDHGHAWVGPAQLVEEREPLLSGGRVSLVVQVEQDGVERSTRLGHGFEHLARRTSAGEGEAISRSRQEEELLQREENLASSSSATSMRMERKMARIGARARPGTPVPRMGRGAVPESRTRSRELCPDQAGSAPLPARSHRGTGACP